MALQTLVGQTPATLTTMTLLTIPLRSVYIHLYLNYRSTSYCRCCCMCCCRCCCMSCCRYCCMCCCKKTKKSSLFYNLLECNLVVIPTPTLPTTIPTPLVENQVTQYLLLSSSLVVVELLKLWMLQVSMYPMYRYFHVWSQ